MIHEKYTCLCCNDMMKNARNVDVDNLENVVLCNSCNLELINRGQIRLTDEVILKTNGYRGNFIRVVAEIDLTTEKFWSNRKRVKELAQMDNQSTVGWDVHESY